jgi:hypothetical protein
MTNARLLGPVGIAEYPHTGTGTLILRKIKLAARRTQ